MKEFIRTILIAILIIGPTVTFSVPNVLPALKWAKGPAHSVKLPEIINFKASYGSGRFINTQGKNEFDKHNPTVWKINEDKNAPCVNTCMQKRDGYFGEESISRTKTT